MARAVARRAKNRRNLKYRVEINEIVSVCREIVALRRVVAQDVTSPVD
jgi:hypothetical protein